MVWQKVQSWLGMGSPVLTLTLVGREVRYVVRQRSRVLVQGCCTAPQAFREGQLVTPEALVRVLLPLLPRLKGQVGKVAVLLPTSWLQLHEVSLPAGLDAEELKYQMNRYVTYTLGLNSAEVFFDWAIQNADADKRMMTVLLAVARQADVALFHRMFVDSGWHLQWVCPEPQVWAEAYQAHAAVERPVAVCQIEPHALSFCLIEADGRVQSFWHAFDERESAGVGFVYQSGGEDEAPDGWVRFPSRFVGDLLAQYLPSWLGTTKVHDLNKVYATGKGVDWAEAIPLLQSRFGVPFRLAEETLSTDMERSFSTVAVGNQPQMGLAAVWWLSKQVVV